jgi:predicted TIM-barrel fold metal-dependent hydrolase
LSKPRVIDAQLHAHDLAEVDAHVATMVAAGVDAAVLVQTVPQGYDNSFLLRAAAAHAGTFAVVGVLDPAGDHVEDDVLEWRATRFALGLRIVAVSAARRARLRGDGYESLVAGCARAGVPVFVYAPRNLDAVGRIAARHPDARIILDHIGLPQPPLLEREEDAWADLERVRRLAALENVALKLSGVPLLSRAAFPFPDLWPALHGLLEAYGAARVMWGTDITREGVTHTYQQALAYVRDADELGADDKALLLGGALRSFCGWDAAVGETVAA